MKTIFTFRNGTKRYVSEKTAKALHRIRLGTYATRDMTADRAFPGTPDTRTIHEVDAEIKQANAGIAPEPVEDTIDAVSDEPETVVEGDELDVMDRDALFALAVERGIKVHHKAGADKIRKALRGE